MAERSLSSMSEKHPLSWNRPVLPRPDSATVCEQVTSSTSPPRPRLQKKLSIAQIAISTPLPHPFPGSLAPKIVQTLIERPALGRADSSSEPRDDLPPWDRVVDIVYHKHRREERPANTEDLFSACLCAFLGQHERQPWYHPRLSYLGLPDTIRYRICRHLIASHAKAEPTPICLSHRTACADA
ncbi:alpha beta hydrolase fold protein [Verticillium dahliae]